MLYFPLTNQHCSKRQGCQHFRHFHHRETLFVSLPRWANFGMFLSVTQWSDHCVPWQILFVGVVVWALAPFVCLVCCSSLTKRNLAWDLRVVWLVCVILVCCDLPAFSDLLSICTNDVFTAHAHVRTEPQCDISHTRGKKGPLSKLLHCLNICSLQVLEW